jgi:hypothetical protein
MMQVDRIEVAYKAVLGVPSCSELEAGNFRDGLANRAILPKCIDGRVVFRTSDNPNWPAHRHVSEPCAEVGIQDYDDGGSSRCAIDHATRLSGYRFLFQHNS